MRMMNFDRPAKGEGREKAGMVSAYLLMNDEGEYLVSASTTDKLTYSPDWSKAEFFFGLQGLTRLRQLCDKFGGTIMIVNAFLPERYYNQ